jgi:hypothetical protein
MEASGFFSIFENKDKNPGLSLMPPEDSEIHLVQEKPDEALKACISCGNLARSPGREEHCVICNEARWDTAVL